MSEKTGTDLEKVKELIQLMIDNGLVEVEVEDEDSKISLKRPNPQAQIIGQYPMPMQAMPMPSGSAPAAPSAGAATVGSDENLVEIKSPMVGTFYSAPSPDSDAFVEVGGKVKTDTVVCIVEAMKVMNEIKADVSGTIVEVMCKAGEAVEFGQVLFKVKP